MALVAGHARVHRLVRVHVRDPGPVADHALAPGRGAAAVLRGNLLYCSGIFTGYMMVTSFGDDFVS